MGAGRGSLVWVWGSASCAQRCSVGCQRPEWRARDSSRAANCTSNQGEPRAGNHDPSFPFPLSVSLVDPPAVIMRCVPSAASHPLGPVLIIKVVVETPAIQSATTRCARRPHRRVLTGWAARSNRAGQGRGRTMAGPVHGQAGTTTRWTTRHTSFTHECTHAGRGVCISILASLTGRTPLTTGGYGRLSGNVSGTCRATWVPRRGNEGGERRFIAFSYVAPITTGAL